MKGAWRALWERRPRLGHKGRAARNLLLVLALAALVWGQYGCPMPTAEMAFRQLEGQYLLPRSEIVYQIGSILSPWTGPGGRSWGSFPWGRGRLRSRSTV